MDFAENQSLERKDNLRKVALSEGAGSQVKAIRSSED